MTLKTIEERRKTDRERLKRWREKKLAAGNKQVQLMLTPEAQAVLKQEKERTGEPFVSIINRAIVRLGEHPLPAPVQTGKDQTSEPESARELIFEMDKKGKDEWEISRVLNDNGVPTLDDKKEWYPSTVRNFLKSNKT